MRPTGREVVTLSDTEKRKSGRIKKKKKTFVSIRKKI